MTGFYATGEVAIGSTAATVTDTSAASLTAASATATGTTTATGSVTTNKAGGTLYFLASSSSTATAAQVKAGASQAVTAVGVQSANFTGLPAAATLYPHYLHRDAAGNDSTVVDGASFTTQAAADTTAPTLSAPTAAANGNGAGAGTVFTNEGNGTLFFMASTNATETAVTVKGGATQPISSTGTKNVAVASLLASTVYYLHYLHRDAAGNESAVVNSAGFTTPGSGAGTATYVQETFESPQGLPWTNLAGMRWYFFDQVWPTPLGAPVAQGSLETTDGNAVGYFELAGLTSLAPGQKGTLAYSNTNGDPDQADLVSFFAPVYVR